MDLMFNRTIVSDTTVPEILERRKDNTYLYRYDLQEIVKEESTSEEESSIPSTDEHTYSYVSVMLNGYPNRGEVIKYLIRQLVTLEDELKIINDYNEVVKLVKNYTKTEEYKTYMDYLTIRHEIKSKVSEDFKNLNI